MTTLKTPAPVRSSELVRCGLTKAEVSHILSLISTNEREGWYYGIAAQYWVRSDRIKAKLQAPDGSDNHRNKAT